MSTTPPPPPTPLAGRTRRRWLMLVAAALALCITAFVVLAKRQADAHASELVAQSCDLLETALVQRSFEPLNIAVEKAQQAARESSKYQDFAAAMDRLRIAGEVTRTQLSAEEAAPLDVCPMLAK